MNKKKQSGKTMNVIMKAPFKVGDKVKKWSLWRKQLNDEEVWIIAAVRNAVSQSGYICDVYMENNSKRKLLNFDCDWYVKVIDASLLGEK